MIAVGTTFLFVALTAAPAVAQTGGQKADVLFGKLEATIAQVDRKLEGVMGLHPGSCLRPADTA